MSGELAGRIYWIIWVTNEEVKKTALKN